MKPVKTPALLPCEGMLFAYGWDYFRTSDGICYRRLMVWDASRWWSVAERAAARRDVLFLQVVIAVALVLDVVVIVLAFAGGV